MSKKNIYFGASADADEGRMISEDRRTNAQLKAESESIGWKIHYLKERLFWETIYTDSQWFRTTKKGILSILW